MKWLFALIFLAAGFLHFVRPVPFVKIMPAVLCRGFLGAWTTISGVFEIVLGVMLLVPKCQGTGRVGD